MQLDMQDLRIDTYTASPAVGMRITHIPTDLSVEGQGRYRTLLKQTLMEDLKQRLTNG